MITRNFAITMGVIYLLVGVLGLIPGMISAPPPEAPPVAVGTGYGYLMGLFPVNVLHNLVHLAIGIWGLAAYRSVAHAVTFSRGLAIFYGILTVMGLIPVLKTTFGLIPLFSHDIWLHAVTAAIAAYFGYGTAAEVVGTERIARRAS